MIPEINKYVKIFLRSGMQVLGYVHDWNSKITLRTSKDIKDDTSYFIVTDPKKDLFAYQIIPSVKPNTKKAIKKPSIKLKKISKKAEVLKDNFEELKNSVNRDELSLKKIADLKSELNELEREEMVEKLKSHEIGETGLTSYAIPNFSKSPMSSNPSTKESPREIRFNPNELQNLFRKK